MEQKIKVKDLLRAAKYLTNSKEEYVKIHKDIGSITLIAGSINIRLRDADHYMAPTVSETKPLPETP